MNVQVLLYLQKCINSIIKEVKGWTLNNAENKVVVKSFSGAKVKCMHSYAIPTTELKPDGIIVHCGTNDVATNKQPKEISQDIVDLAVKLKSDSTDVIISGLTTRCDKLETGSSQHRTSRGML